MPLTNNTVARLADLLGAAWNALDAVAANQSSVLQKGPRGGRRDRANIVGHINESEQGSCTSLGKHQARWMTKRQLLRWRSRSLPPEHVGRRVRHDEDPRSPRSEVLIAHSFRRSLTDRPTRFRRSSERRHIVTRPGTAHDMQQPSVLLQISATEKSGGELRCDSRSVGPD